MNNLLIFVSSVLVLISYIVYAKAILKGEAKPHRTTRLTIFVITLISTASLFASKNTEAIWLSGMFALGSFIILFLSIKYGMGGWAKSDIVCLTISLVGILFWRITKNPVLALYFSILADFTGIIPTLIKTFKYPKTEVWTFFSIDVLAALLNLIASSKWSFGDIIYPIYIIFIDSLIIFLIIRPVKK